MKASSAILIHQANLPEQVVQYLAATTARWAVITTADEAQTVTGIAGSHERAFHDLDNVLQGL